MKDEFSKTNPKKLVFIFLKFKNIKKKYLKKDNIYYKIKLKILLYCKYIFDQIITKTS